MLYGGNEDTDTWAWDGMTWTLLQPAAVPESLHAFELVAGGYGDTMVMFGTFQMLPQPLNETWLWAGTTWSQANTLEPPEAAGSPFAGMSCY